MKKRNYISMLRISYSGKSIWISEFLGFLTLSVLFIALITIGVILLKNEQLIMDNNSRLSEFVKDSTYYCRVIAELEEKNNLYETLKSFVSNRLSKNTLLNLTNLVYKNSRTYGYDPFLVMAVIRVESFFEHDALGRYRSGKFSGAFGLMQLKFETAKEVAEDLNIELNSIRDLFNPEINIALGVAYLTRLITQFNSLKLGILAYNQGPGTISENLRSNRTLSIHYYDKVVKHYRLFKQNQPIFDRF